MIKNVSIVVVITIIVTALAYFLGFPMLFAHTAFEVVWYGLLFGIPNVLGLVIGNMFGKKTSK